MNLRADDAALLMAFARIAALRATMLSYDLGEPTRQQAGARPLQAPVAAPRARRGPVCEAVRTRLPQHATVLYCCSECRRVVNSVQDNTGKDLAFNELGLSASMLTVDCDHVHGPHAVRQALVGRAAHGRGSRGVRGALQLEQLEPVASPLLPRDLRPATIVATMCTPKTGGSKRKRRRPRPASASALRDSSSEVAKFRRDLKSCFEQSQQATSCGDVPLVCVPILGRAIRVFGNWYALCSMCGALARVTPASRFRDEICCMRCDFAMLAGKDAASEMRAALPKPPVPSCRYCGKLEPENGAGMKWRCIPAPADTGGRNAFVPPPLRQVLVLPLALPLVAAQCAQDHVHGRHLWRLINKRAAHPRRRQRQQRQASAVGRDRCSRGRQRTPAGAQANQCPPQNARQRSRASSARTTANGGLRNSETKRDAFVLFLKECVCVCEHGA